MSEIEKEIQEALSADGQEIQLETSPNQDVSPLNHPVVEKEAPGAGMHGTDPQVLPGEESNDQGQDIPEEPLDAPEQTFDQSPEEADIDDGGNVQMEDKEAKIVANSILGMFDSGLALGKPLVSLKVKPEYFGDEDILAFVEEQNARGLEAITLSGAEKNMLRPPLIEVVKKRAKKVSPEAQLIGLGIMIMAGKAQTMLSLRKDLVAAEERLMNHLNAKQQEEETDIPDTAADEADEDETVVIPTVEAEVVEEKKDKKKK